MFHLQIHKYEVQRLKLGRRCPQFVSKSRKALLDHYDGLSKSTIFPNFLLIIFYRKTFDRMALVTSLPPIKQLPTPLAAPTSCFSCSIVRPPRSGST